MLFRSETDLAGHSQDSDEYVRVLKIADRKLGELIPLLNEDDILEVQADHGNDPDIGTSKHTRECVPILVYRKGISGVKLGVRRTMSDAGATVCDYFNVQHPENGTSWLDAMGGRPTKK